MTELLLLVVAGVAAGALNAVGGGGTFVALPVLVAAGIPPVTANASSTVALLPGALAAAFTYRRELVPVGPVALPVLTVASLLGGALGAGLLLALPSASFDAVLPWLLAFATLVLAMRTPLTRLGRGRRLGPVPLVVGQFVLAVYGGYFGGAVGIMLLAFWSLGTGLDAATGNPVRVAQLGAINAVAAGIFLVAADVLRHPAPVLGLVVGAMVGGLVGARVGRRLSARTLRAIVLTTAATMTVIYAVQA